MVLRDITAAFGVRVPVIFDRKKTDFLRRFQPFRLVCIGNVRVVWTTGFTILLPHELLYTCVWETAIE